jgi:hypothetical protein
MKLQNPKLTHSLNDLKLILMTKGLYADLNIIVNQRFPNFSKNHKRKITYNFIKIWNQHSKLGRHRNEPITAIIPTHPLYYDPFCNEGEGGGMVYQFSLMPSPFGYSFGFIPFCSLREYLEYDGNSLSDLITREEFRILNK